MIVCPPMGAPQSIIFAIDDAKLRRRMGPSEPGRQSMLEKINKQKLVVIGNGMAGIRTVEVLLDRAPDLYEITVFGSEPYGNYNRILLSPVLAGEKTVNDIMLNTEQWYEDNGITLRKGEMIEMIDRRTCEVVTVDEARHERHRRASARHADGASARSGRGWIAAQVAGRARHGVQDARADAGDPRRGPRHRCAL